MATEYISRQAAINIACDGECEDCPDGGCDMYRRLKRLPAADVRPVVRGHWIEDEYGFVRCSVCGMEWDKPEHPETNFCPNCGADMRGGSHE